MEAGVQLSPYEGIECHVSISEEFSSVVPELAPADLDFMQKELCVPGSVTPMCVPALHSLFQHTCEVLRLGSESRFLVSILSISKLRYRDENVGF